MLADCCREWLRSKKPVEIAGKRFLPLCHPKFPDMPVIVGRCQAETVLLRDELGEVFAIKAFRNGYRLDSSYLTAVTHLLPPHAGLRVGRERLPIAADKINVPPRVRWGATLRDVLANSLLMPRARGVDWACVSDDIRSGVLSPMPQQRLQWLRQLSEIIHLLETAGCAHRDLSSGNVFLCVTGGHVELIDFDSLFHACLPLPRATTCGTEGYTAPFAERDARVSWTAGADRFAMAVLAVEILATDAHSSLGADGGLFSQADLRNRGSMAMQATLRRLAHDFPQAAVLFERVMRARRFQECPSPEEWIDCCDRSVHAALPLTVAPPNWTFDFSDILRRRRPPVASIPACIVTLPEDPWRN